MDLNFAVESGSAGEEAAMAQGYNYIAVDTQADALMEVSAGTSDACIIDLLMAGAMIGEGTSYPDLTYTPWSSPPRNTAWASARVPIWWPRSTSSSPHPMPTVP